jgi:hypothetical protein
VHCHLAQGPAHRGRVLLNRRLDFYLPLRTTREVSTSARGSILDVGPRNHDVRYTSKRTCSTHQMTSESVNTGLKKLTFRLPNRFRLEPSPGCALVSTIDR